MLTVHTLSKRFSSNKKVRFITLCTVFEGTVVTDRKGVIRLNDIHLDPKRGIAMVWRRLRK